jgi:hypothetical protein
MNWWLQHSANRALRRWPPQGRTKADADYAGTTFAEILKDRKSARKVSYNEPLAVPKGHDISLDRQETPSGCGVAPVIAALKDVTSQAEGTAMDARGAPLARRRFRARDYRLAHHRTPRPLESSQCRRGTPETHRRNKQPG